MENQNERSLAYQIAQKIEMDELDKVSGGTDKSAFTTKETFNRYGGDFGVDAIW